MQLSSPLLDRLFLLITNLGSPRAFIILASLFTLLLLVKKKKVEALCMNLCLIISWQLMNGLKIVFARPRPLGEHLTYASGFSFPSGHAMLSIAFYGFLAYLALSLLPRKIGKILAAILAILILLIGLSRIYLNVHYASDVIAGYIFGAIVLYVFLKVMLSWTRQ